MDNLLKITIFCIGIALISVASNPILASEPFPAPNSIFLQVKSNPEAWNGKLVSFEGMVTQIEKGPYNKPYYKINMPQPILEELWIGSILQIDTNTITKNDIIRVLGYYAAVEKDDPVISINKSGYHVLGFCFLNVSTKKAYYFPGGIEQCRDWEKGIIKN